MRRGTTPYLTIETGQDLTGYARVIFTIEDRQGTEVDVASDSGNMEISADHITVKLTQDQTLSLQKGAVKMQIRAVDTGGNAIASNIMQSSMEDILKEGAI